MDVSTSGIVPLFVLVSHSFRMELFFLIAGFFSHMTFHGKGAGSFIKSRVMRIALPFVAGWLILRPLLVASWAMGGESMQGDVNIPGSLWVGIQSLAQLPQGLSVGTHLWFLYYLLLITGIALTFRFLTSLMPSRLDQWTRKSDSVIAWLARSRFGIIAISIPTAACMLFMNNWSVDTPDLTLAPRLPVLLLYGSFFLIGWMFHRKKYLIEQFATLSLGRFVLATLAIYGTIELSKFQSDIGHPNASLIRIGFALSYATMMWSLVAIAIGVFKRYFDKPSKLVRYLADASYWLYLIHLPIVIFLQIAFAELSLHWTLKLTAISAITIGFSLLLYDLFVRNSILGKILNGRKKPSALLPSTRRLARFLPFNRVNLPMSESPSHPIE